MQNNSGITMIALAITMIIMVILATISVTVLSGDNSLIKKAEEAKQDTDVKQEEDIINQAVYQAMNNNRYGELDKTELENALNSIAGKDKEGNNKVTVTLNGNKFKVYFIESGRKYNVDTDGNVTKKENVVIADGLTIGSDVTYEPTGNTYTWQGKYATTDTITTTNGVDTTTDDKVLNSTSGGADRITTWKVFKIDEDEGKIQLVPTVTKTAVKLEGAPGYNNAVQLLDEACSTLYSDSSKGITAESIDMDDIEPLLDEEKLQTEKNKYNHNNTTSYSYLVDRDNEEYDQVSSAYSKSKSYFPRIYEEEKYSVINGNKKSSGLGLSSPGSKLYERDEATSLTNQTTGTTANTGYFQANESIQPYQTYYSWTSALSTAENYADSATSSAYASMLKKTYWVASRCVDTDSGVCSFRVRYVSAGNLYYNSVFYSNSLPDVNSRALFPVVTLSSDLIEKNGSSFKVK